MKGTMLLSNTALGIILLFTAMLSAQVPQLINYQGILNDPNTGAPISGSKSMTFSIYSVPSGGAALWSESQTVSVNNGYFSVLLGSTTSIPPSVFSGGDRYLGVKIGSDPEMTPRKRIVSVGYAIMANDADKVDGQDASDFATAAHDHWGEEWSGNGVGLRLSSSNDYGLYAYGSGYPAIYAESGAFQLPRPSGSIGIYGYATDTGVFGWGTNFGMGGRSTNGVGVKGLSTNNDGVVGETSASEKSGVYGYSTRGFGVTGRSTNNYGVQGVTTVSGKSGVYGHSTQGIGVEGRSNANNGVVGWTNKHEASGVYGHSPFGIGVAGRSQGNDGLLGVTTSNQPGHAGVRARNEGGGPAIFCEGDHYVTGAVRGNIGNGGAPFPRPAYDSGWLGFAQNQTRTLQHNLGGNPDDYFIYMWFRRPGSVDGINQIKYGLDWNSHDEGAAWYGLTSSTITVYRSGEDLSAPEIRVRIWVIR